MDFIEEKKNEIKNEINKMSLEELLYLQLNPNYFIYNKMKPQIEQIKKQNNQVQSKQKKLDDIYHKQANEDMNDTNILKNHIEQINTNIKRLIMKRDNIKNNIPKDEFLNLLNDELKKMDNPDACFSRLKEKKIDAKQFQKEFAELGKQKNYYYYKLIYDRIKND